MATHSSILAWRVPGTEEPGGLPSMRSHRVSHNGSDSAAAAATANYLRLSKKFSSVQFSRSVTSDSLRPHESQHARPPCLPPTPGVYSNSCPSSRWCHPAISPSVVPFSHLLSFPAWESFPMSQFFTSGGQTIGVSASASVLPMNIQDWFPLGLTDLNSLQSKGLSRVFSNTKFKSINYSMLSLLMVHTRNWKNHSFH